MSKQNIEESVESRVCFEELEDWVGEKIQGWVQELLEVELPRFHGHLSIWGLSNRFSVISSVRSIRGVPVLSPVLASVGSWLPFPLAFDYPGPVLAVKGSASPRSAPWTAPGRSEGMAVYEGKGEARTGLVFGLLGMGEWAFGDSNEP